MKKTGIELITEERKEQIEKHGYTIENDIKTNSDNYQLTYVAQALCRKEMHIITATPKGWDYRLFSKMIEKPYKERLIIAGALIAAEIDRIQNE